MLSVVIVPISSRDVHRDTHAHEALTHQQTQCSEVLLQSAAENTVPPLELVTRLVQTCE